MVDKWVEFWEKDFFDMANEKRQTWRGIQGFITKEEAKGMPMPELNAKVQFSESLEFPKTAA